MKKFPVFSLLNRELGREGFAEDYTHRHLFQRKYLWNIELKIKEDEEGKFHARYLEIQGMAVMVDPGYDFFKRKLSVSEFRRCIFKNAKSDFGHSQECRKLEDFKI